MDGNVLTIVCTVIVTALGLAGLLVRHGRQQGVIDTKVSQIVGELPTLRHDVTDHGNRLTILETTCKGNHPAQPMTPK